MSELGHAVPELGNAVSATPEVRVLAYFSGSDFGPLNVAVGVHGVSVSLSTSSSASIIVRDETRCPG